MLFVPEEFLVLCCKAFLFVHDSAYEYISRFFTTQTYTFKITYDFKLFFAIPINNLFITKEHVLDKKYQIKISIYVDL